MKRFELIEHTADIAIRAYGDSLSDAFEAAAGALFAIITDGATIAPTTQTAFEVESVDIEGLLVGFLSELIVQLEVEQLVLNDFHVNITDDTHMKAMAGAERFDESKHGSGYAIKGVSYHMMEIVDNSGKPEESYVQVLFDI